MYNYKVLLKLIVTIIIVHGTQYENKANLAEKFFFLVCFLQFLAF